MNMLILPGTNRAGSMSQRLGTIVAAHYRELGHAADLVDLSEILTAPFIEPSMYKTPSEPVIAWRDRFLSSDGVVFIVPEYNGGFPGVLKLMIDALPFPEGLDRRPCAFIGLAAGRFQALRAVEQLQLVCGYRNAYIYPQRVFIGDSFSQFDHNEDRLSNDELSARLYGQAEGFAEFVTRLK